MEKKFLFLTGASGSGKTALAKAVKARCSELCDVFYFDSIGVPSHERMETEFGSCEAWQRAMTMQWVKRLAERANGKTGVLLEGQMRIAFLVEAIAHAELQNYRILLIDCGDSIRAERLIRDRLQPELANQEMMNWARYLRAEAEEFQCQILDTGKTPFDACVDSICNEFHKI